MNKCLYKKTSNEDKFARHYYKNPQRFVHKMKRASRKETRRIFKKECEVE